MRYWTVHRQCVVVGRIWLLQSLQPVRPLQPVQASAPAGAAGTHRKYACAWPYCRASRKLQRIAAAYRKPLHGGTRSARTQQRTPARTQRRTVWDGAADTATWIGRAGDRLRCGGTVDVINGYKRLYTATNRALAALAAALRLHGRRVPVLLGLRVDHRLRVRRVPVRVHLPRHHP